MLALQYLARADKLGNFSATHVAEVEVDPSIMKLPYGQRLLRDPRIILAALASSLELGVSIAIKAVNDKAAKHPESHIPFGKIAYIGTSNNGQRRILHTINHL